MKFEYDKVKSALNKEKHGIDFEKAQYLWDDDFVIFKAKTSDEQRFMIIGKIKNKTYSCIFTLRNNSIRIISCRRSRENEERGYYEKLK
jgi:uncharacterized protein